MKAAKKAAKKTEPKAAAPKTAVPVKKPVEPVKHADQDAPRIETRLVVGGVGYPVDASDLARTIGAARYGHGMGLVDAWPDAAWVGILVHLGLPSDPLDREAAGQVVRREVQRLWYEAVQGGVPEERRQVFEERDKEKAAAYTEGFGAVKEASEARRERARSVGFGRQGETKYVPTEALKKKGVKFGGQAALLLAYFKAAKFAPATTAEATAGMVAAGLKTTTKPERIAGFYLCSWCKKGLLARETAQ